MATEISPQINTGINSNAYYADYSNIASCLSAIYNAEVNGEFSGKAEVLRLLRLLEKDLLKKLYSKAVKSIGNLDGIWNPKVNYIGGDFSEKSFSQKDYSIGYAITISSSKNDYFYGDFEGEDFFFTDFYVDLLDTSNSGYSAVFQTVVNIIDEIVNRGIALNDEDAQGLNEVLLAFLDGFRALQDYLLGIGLNICGTQMGVAKNNTKGVYLQVAGADGSDGIAEGFHLRWSFTAELGDNHLPKGGYFNGSSEPLSFFNKKDDFVHLVKTPYVNPIRFEVDFEQCTPVINFLSKTWTYTITQAINGKKVTNKITLKFSPTDYKRLAKIINPSLNPVGFLKQFNGKVLLSVADKSSFAIGFDFKKLGGTDDAFLKIEALCKLPEESEEDAQLIRKSVQLKNESTTSTNIKGENITEIRLKKSSNGFIKKFSFETYDDFLSSRSASAWASVGDGFSLSLSDDKVLNRLENENYPIDNIWPKYNDGTRVRISNYRDKWLISAQDDPSIKDLLQSYLEKSVTDPRAIEFLKKIAEDEEESGSSISFLDVINLHGLDYHFARMFGLGHIDTPENVNANDQFIYQLRYRNKKSMGSPELIDYVYTSLPISKLDKLAPEKPKMRPLSYQVTTSYGDALNIGFDEKGYSKYDNARAINIGREPYTDELENYDFFADLTKVEDFNIFQHARAVFYGIEYRSANDTKYVKPEITSSEPEPGIQAFYDYDDTFTGNLPEMVPVMENPDSLFIHFERDNGVHFYAIYAINWFSRASVLSDEVATDETSFKPANMLHPPTDVAVQYIQKESTLVFTTGKEQEWLEGRSETFNGQDIDFTRVTFNWLDIHDVSRLKDTSKQELETIVKADTINAYFNPALPLEIIGVISGFKAVQGNENQIQLLTDSYQLIDGTVVKPAIEPKDYFRFSNSLLSTQTAQFKVVSISSGIKWPIITIEKIEDNQVVDDEENPGTFATQSSFILPEKGSRFSMVENLSNDANWKKITEKIQLYSFADADNPLFETTQTEGNTSTYWIGGIHEEAQVEPLFGNTDPADDLPGYYRVSFGTGVSLPQHPQVNIPFEANNPTKNAPNQSRKAHVEWYKGYVRMPSLNNVDEKKLLEVVRIEEDDPLTLYIFDPGFVDDPIVSSVNNSSVIVNFHPGYRAYLFAEPSGAFNALNIQPTGGDSDKKTLIGLQSADTRFTERYVSRVSLPSILLAIKIEEPVEFERPQAPLLKVRPDETGKAAFTFDVKIKPAVNGALRSPFGFMFYRTAHLDVLDALYAPETVSEILTALANLEEDPFYSQRYVELVDLVFDENNAGHFNVLGDSPNQYGFPIPDKAGLTASNDDLPTKIVKYNMAIHQTLLPLTEQPPIFGFIKEGIYTENVVPKIRDIDGHLLSLSNPGFNPFPMVRKFVKPNEANTTYLRFTDYFLDEASRNLYFYSAIELTEKLEPGYLSPFVGPVTILHTNASAPPLITKMTINSPFVLTEANLSVTFQVAPISAADKIERIRVYRTTNIDHTVALSLMDSYFDVELAEDGTEGYLITDDFSDLAEIPYGETVSYRFAGIRKIINEKEEEEDVFSTGSDVLNVQLYDDRNPVAPILEYIEAENKLVWEATAKNSSYHLFKQNNKGNWEKVIAIEPLGANKEMEYVLPASLAATDEGGNKLYYRYKVQVQSASGLFNLIDNEITISKN